MDRTTNPYESPRTSELLAVDETNDQSPDEQHGLLPGYVVAIGFPIALLVGAGLFMVIGQLLANF